MMTRSFERTDGKSEKFWTITLDREQYTVKFGRRGTPGQTQAREIGSADKAQQAFDKLVAEKLKKGYKETSAAAIGAAAASPPAPVLEPARGSLTVPLPVAEAGLDRPKHLSDKFAAPVKSGPQPDCVVLSHPPDPELQPKNLAVPATPPPEAAPQPDGDGHAAASASESPIRLAPWDWMIATWRPRQPALKPAHQPFDREAAMTLFRRWVEIAIKEQWWWTGWSRLELPAGMSREEARFWFHALLGLMRVMYLQHPPAGTADGWRKELREEADRCLQQLSNLDLCPELPLNEAARMLRNGRPSPLLLVPLLSLYPMSDTAEFLVEASCSPAWNDLGDDCLRARVIRYLSDEDLDLLREAIRRRLPGQTSTPVRTPGNPYPASSYIFRLAAVVGVGEELTKVVEAWPGASYYSFLRTHSPQDIVFGLPSAALVSQHMRRLRYRLATPGHIRAWLAHTELGQMELIRHSIAETTNRKEAAELTEAFALAVVAPEAAPVMLSLALESKAPQVAHAWLMEHPAETIAGLSTVAAGKDRHADAAIEILRDLDRAGHGAALQSEMAPAVFQKVAAHRKAGTNPTGSAVLDAVSTPAGLAAAFEEALRIKAKLPPWAAPALLPPILTAAGCSAGGVLRLNDDQTTIVLKALATSVLPNPHPLLLALRSYATPASLDRFAWSLFERWLGNGAPAREKWALGAVGLYGGDQSAISLAGLIRVWPGQGKHQAAVLGLECLRAIGTDTALIQIGATAQRVKFQAIKARAQECMEEIAADLKLTRAQLEDRVVPDCGLDEHGSRTFDFGARQFRLLLGPGLKPLVVDAAGRRRPDLPKPNSRDDAAKTEEAAAAWKLVRKQIAEVVKVETGRLEQALVTGRQWTVNEFESLFLRHPFLMNMAPRLVWGVFRDGKPALTFRVTEDQSLRDEYDQPLTLPKNVAIGLVHPMHLEASSLAAWGELLSDYEIMPPFPQLGRPIYRATEAELQGDTFARHTRVSIPAASLAGTLERLGWQRGPVEDAGMYHWHGKHFSEFGFGAILEHEPIVSGMPADSDPTPINACYFSPGECRRAGWGHETERIPLKKIDPLILSEILSDLQIVASMGNHS